MRWEDVDLVGADWRYVVSKTKHLDKGKHIVPLPEQALVLLRELHKTRVVDFLRINFRQYIAIRLILPTE